MRHCVCLTALALLVWAANSARGQHTYYVDALSGDDSWSGRCRQYESGTCGPKKCIQAGLDASADGDTIVVLDGTYTGPGNRELKFGGRAVTLRSENGPSSCLISGLGSDFKIFFFDSGETPATVLDGFTITDTAVC